MTMTSAAKPVAAGDTMTAIAERAYFKAERRGFMPGFELDDWLAAEQEILLPPKADGGAKPKRTRKRAAEPKE